MTRLMRKKNAENLCPQQRCLRDVEFDATRVSEHCAIYIHITPSREYAARQTPAPCGGVMS